MQKALLILALLACLVGLFVVDFAFPTRNFERFFNALHAPAFAVLTIALLQWSRKFLPRGKATALTILTALLVGLVGEILQVSGPRDADFLDLVNDGIGIATGICLASIFAIRAQAGRRTQFRLAILILLPLLTLTLAPAAWYGHAAIAQQLAMPKLLSFDAWWESSLYRASGNARLQLEQAPPNWPKAATRLAKITSTGHAYPGIRIEPMANWENYETLTFYAASANHLEVPLTISIYHADTNRLYGDWFDYAFAIGPAPELITIKLSDIRSASQSRDTTLQAVKEVVIFIGNTTGHEEFFLDEFQLN